MGRKEESGNAQSHPASDPSVHFMLAGIAGVIGVVWLVLWLGGGSSQTSRPSEEQVVLSRSVTLLPPSGAWLGIDTRLDEANLRPEGTLPPGVVISRVMAGSPAYQAGLRAGDVIERVGDATVRLPFQLGRVISRHRQGQTIHLTINRQGRQRKLHVKLGSRPMGRLAAATTKENGAWMGVDVQDIDALMAERLGLPDRRGVIIASIHPGSPAAKCGLQQGDVIRRVADTRLRDITQVEDLLAGHQPGETVSLAVWHHGAQRQVRVTLSSPPPPALQPKPTLPEAEVEIEAAWLGLDIVPLSPREAEELGLSENVRGVVVDDVAAGRGVDAGFQVGDVIVAVNGDATETIMGFKDATEGAVGALVDVVRAGRHVYITVPPPGAQGPRQSKPPVRRVTFRLH